MVVVAGFLVRAAGRLPCVAGSDAMMHFHVGIAASRGSGALSLMRGCKQGLDSPLPNYLLVTAPQGDRDCPQRGASLSELEARSAESRVVTVRSRGNVSPGTRRIQLWRPPEFQDGPGLGRRSQAGSERQRCHCNRKPAIKGSSRAQEPHVAGERGEGSLCRESQRPVGCRDGTSPLARNQKDRTRRLLQFLGQSSCFFLISQPPPSLLRSSNQVFSRSRLFRYCYA